MTARQFRLQKVLDTRTHQQKQSQIQLYENIGKQQIKLDEITRLKKNRTQLVEQLLSEVKRGTEGGRAKLLSLLAVNTHQRINVLNENVDKLKVEEERIRLILERRTREKKMLEKLREKTFELQRIEENHKEQKDMDDTVTKKLVINQR